MWLNFSCFSWSSSPLNTLFLQTRAAFTFIFHNVQPTLSSKLTKKSEMSRDVSEKILVFEACMSLGNPGEESKAHQEVNNKCKNGKVSDLILILWSNDIITSMVMSVQKLVCNVLKPKERLVEDYTFKILISSMQVSICFHFNREYPFGTKNWSSFPDLQCKVVQLILGYKVNILFWHCC